MKTILTLATFIALATLTNCGSKDPAVTESQRVTTLLKATPWKIQSLSVDGLIVGNFDEYYELKINSLRSVLQGHC